MIFFAIFNFDCIQFSFFLNNNKFSIVFEMEIDHPLLGRFKVIKAIGEGSFASVYLAQNINLGYPIAIKMFQDKSEEKHINDTFNITKSIMHPFICQDFDLMKTTQGNSILLMEYIEGKTLLEYANSCSPLPESVIQTIFGQLVIAIDFLHKHNIIHRDLKCENIMIDKNKNIRLIDLSFSCQNIDLHSTICGSPGYIAPEMINNDLYTDSIDIWSLGIIIYAITYGKLPFYHQNIVTLNCLITSIEPFYPNVDGISQNLIDLIKRMLTKDPQKRIQIEEIKNHPFFTSDSNGNRYLFNDQQINYFIRNPYSKMIPETQIIQQMKLPTKESIDAINEIKSGTKSHYSMTYTILFKNFVSNIQLQYYSHSFLCPINEKIKESKTDSTANFLPLMIDIKNIAKNQATCKTDRVANASKIKFDASNLQLTESPNSSRENFSKTKQIGTPLLIKGNVHFRRFSSIGMPFATAGVKKNILNLKNIPLTTPSKKQCQFSSINFQKESSISLASLPHLITQEEK